MVETTYQGIPDTLTFLPLSPPRKTLHFAPSEFMTLNEAGGGEGIVANCPPVLILLPDTSSKVVT